MALNVPVPTRAKLDEAEEEIVRLQSLLKEREDQTINTRFRTLEDGMEEVKNKLGIHACPKEADWRFIQDAQLELKDRLDSATKVRFWGYAGTIIGLILAALSAVYAFATEQVKWQQTTSQVTKVENSVNQLKSTVEGMTISFKLMENEQRVTQEQLKRNTMTPDDVKAAVREALHR